LGNEFATISGAAKTFELWARFNSSSAYGCLIYIGSTGGGYAHLALWREQSTGKLIAKDESSGDKVVASGPISDDVWYHISVVTHPGTGTIGSVSRMFYVDGVLAGIWRGYTTIAGSNDLYIGKWGADWAPGQFIGQMDDIRITHTARYPLPWSPVASALSDDASTSLLLHLDSTITDDSSNGHSLTTGGATAPTITATGPKVGAGCLDFTAGNGYVLTPSHADFEFGTGDWAIEFWMLSNGTNGAGTWAGIISVERPSTTDGVITISNRGNGNAALSASLYFGSAWYDLVAKDGDALIDPNDNAWHHVVLQRSGNFVALWFDGVQTDGVQVSASDAFGVSGRGFHLGYNQGDNAYFRGKLDEVRITKGAARYATGFLPPAAQFPDE
jgi:hypothetical protein